MKRYASTLYLFWTTSIATEMEYRSNFVLAAINSMMGLAGALFVLWMLFRSGYELGGWSWPEAMLVVAAYTLLDGVQACVLAPNRQQITEMVREGTLDFVLLKPIDSQFWLSVRQARLWGVPNLLLGVGLFVYAAQHLDPPLAIAGYAAFVLPMAVGIVVLYALGYLLSTLTIWFVKMDNITITMQALLEAGRYPIAGYPAAYRVFFTFVLPVAFMTTVPAELAVGRRGWSYLFIAVAVAVVMLIASRLFWRYALRHYTSASS